MTASFNNPNAKVGPNTVVRGSIGPGGTDLQLGANQLVQQSLAKEIVAPLTGASVTISDQTAKYILNPAGTLSTLTVTMPANPFDGQQVSILSSQTVTTLTHSANTNQTLNGALTTITAVITTHGSWVWDAASATWYATV